MSRRKKRKGNWLSRLNILFWALAATVWLLVLVRGNRSEQAETSEPSTDPIHVTGSSQPPPHMIVENGTRSDFELVPGEALIAFIIDDFGPAWNSEVVEGFLNFPADLTLSVIPGNRRSKQVAVAARKSGKELFIHLPMEPTDRVALGEPDMVWTKSSATELHKILDRAIGDVPGAVGINNHMGSKATGSLPLMNLLAAELLSRRLVFIDSRTTERSEALMAMHESGVDALGRDVFLDVEGDSASVAARIAQTARIARKRGWAVAIGHVKRATLAALKAAAPELEQQGFQIVSASTLIKKVMEPAASVQ